MRTMHTSFYYCVQSKAETRYYHTILFCLYRFDKVAGCMRDIAAICVSMRIDDSPELNIPLPHLFSPRRRS